MEFNLQTVELLGFNKHGMLFGAFSNLKYFNDFLLYIFPTTQVPIRINPHKNAASSSGARG